jgi:hypothetical protein
VFSYRRLTGSLVVVAALAIVVLATVHHLAARARAALEADTPEVLLSGVVTDDDGRALAGVSVRFGGALAGATSTARNGRYALFFPMVRADELWSASPSRQGCVFSPASVAFRGARIDAQATFVGAGEGCRGTERVAPRDGSPVDPGPRPGKPGAGGPWLRKRNSETLEKARIACLPGLAPPMRLLCEEAFLRFQEIDSVSGSIEGEEGAGLGPTFNGNGCAMCHEQPALLGSAVAPFSPQRPHPNPQVSLAHLDGARNIVPSFVVDDGPPFVARFKSDGQVHGLYTIAGRSDARTCAQVQPDFANAIARDDLSVRIPLSLFGLGLVEAVSESALEANLAESRSLELGIDGAFNRSVNEGTINRFGWKAQTKSILAFAGEAYNVEIGVTNELFPEERSGSSGCLFNGTPEDHTDPSREGSVSDTNSDVQNFALAIRLSAPPRPSLPPGVDETSVERGRARFEATGCARCHTPTLTTATSNLDPALGKVAFHPFSDFAIHRMGRLLADGIAQGSAGADQFRTTPLWGVGQRLFFLHDGRTSDLVEAIRAHSSPGSEAAAVIANFERLGGSARQDVINFLRSL